MPDDIQLLGAQTPCPFVLQILLRDAERRARAEEKRRESVESKRAAAKASTPNKYALACRGCGRRPDMR